jgi:hypothetical protein
MTRRKVLPEFLDAAKRSGHVDVNTKSIAAATGLSGRAVRDVLTGDPLHAGKIAVARVRGVLGLPLEEPIK